MNECLFDQLPAPGIWLNQEARIEHLNPAARLFLERLRQELGDPGPLEDLARRWLLDDLHHYLDLPHFEHTFEKSFSIPTGTRCLAATVKHVETSDGNRLGTVVLLEDITARRRLEDELRQAYRDLERQVAQRTAELEWANSSLRHYIDEYEKAARERLKLFRAVEQTTDAILVTDRNGVIEYANPALERISGYSRAELLGKTPRFLKSGRHEPAFYRGLWETILGGGVFRAVFINRRKDGQLYAEDKIISPITDEHGRITHFLSTGRETVSPADSERPAD